MGTPNYILHATESGLPAFLFTRNPVDPEALSSSAVNFTTAMTLVAFVRPIEFASAAVYATQAAMSLVSDHAGGKFSFGIDGYHLKVMFYSTPDAAEQSFDTSGWVGQPRLYDGHWHAIGVVISATGVVTFYIDGLPYLAGSRTTSGWETLHIDTYGVGVDALDPFGGYFAEDYAYNAALSLSDMQGLSTWLHAVWDTSEAPALISSTPMRNSTGNTASEPVSFVIQAVGTQLDNTTLHVWVDGVSAYVSSAFQTGFAGTNTLNGDDSRTIAITTRPPAYGKTSTVTIYVKDVVGREGYFSFTYYVTQADLSNLVAKTWCEGKRIDLSWTLPGGVTQVLIRRSSISYAQYTDDAGETVYSGAPIEAFVDGLYTGATATTNKALEEGRFYYYSFFISYSGSPYVWLHSASGEVEGLSIKDYYALYGDYVYALLPKTYRQRDADPGRGSDQFALRDYCSVLQCGVNLYRGWNEAILLFKDPDLMPAGQMGIPENQRGILEAANWDLGIAPERSFDAGVLRRVALGLVGVLKKKGTCPGLVDLTKLFTTWDSRCDEVVEPICGVTRLFTSWDPESFIDDVHTTAYANYDLSTAGQLSIHTNSIYKADKVTATTLLTTPPFVAFVLDALGTFACVQSVTPGVTVNTLTFADPAAKLRAEITGAGTSSSGNTFTINSINATSYPWQFPSPAAEPVYGTNAFATLKLMDSAGTIVTVVSSDATDALGDTVLHLSAAVVTGSFSLAWNFDLVAGTGTYSGRKPLFQARLYFGEFSLTYDPLWDVRLKDEVAVGPWSLVTALGSSTAGSYAPTPADAVVWAQGVHQELGKATGVSPTTLQDTAKSWTGDTWKGMYLLPDWGQSRVFRITGNNANTLAIDVQPGAGIDDLAAPNSHYVILDERNALKYARLAALLPSFVPHETRPYVKFEV